MVYLLTLLPFQSSWIERMDVKRGKKGLEMRLYLDTKIMEFCWFFL
jgi:hypothetical protein